MSTSTNTPVPRCALCCPRWAVLVRRYSCLSVSSTSLDLRFSVTRKSRSRYALQGDLDQPAECLTLRGFPNQRQTDSRWQTEGRLPWARLLRCGTDYTAVDCKPAKIAKAAAVGRWGGCARREDVAGGDGSMVPALGLWVIPIRRGEARGAAWTRPSRAAVRARLDVTPRGPSCRWRGGRVRSRRSTAWCAGRALRSDHAAA